MEENKTPISSEDLWTIFTSCPLEKGSIEVYHEFTLAREREKKQAANKNLEGFEM